MSGARRPIALTLGDPAGIAPEITAAAHARLAAEGGPAFFLIGDVALARTQGPAAAIDAPEAAAAVFGDALPVLPEPLARAARPGAPDDANAPAVLASLERATALTLSGAARALVTNPIHKAGLKRGAGFSFPGHTEFLADRAGGMRPVMMLAGPSLRVVPLTVHVALAAVPALITAALIAETARIVEAALRRDFGLERPRIAVAGLNPHAGEDGEMGREEIETLRPALDALRAEGLALLGPLPADTLFHAAARARYDAALCMYHDQALIAVKTLDFDTAVNVTLGLPFVRTSPDHGVAYDIAGQGHASPTSLIEAIRLADRLSARRGAA